MSSDRKIIVGLRPDQVVSVVIETVKRVGDTAAGFAGLSGVAQSRQFKLIVTQKTVGNYR